MTPEPDPSVYLEAFRREHDPGADAAAAALARMQARIAEGDGLADDAAPVVETGLRTSTKVIVAALAFAAAVALALQLDVGGWIARRGQPDGSDHAAAYAGGGGSEGSDATVVSPARSTADAEPREVVPTPPDAEAEAETETEAETEAGNDEAVDDDEAVDPEVTAETSDVRPTSRPRPRPTPAPEPTAPGDDATLLAELSLLKSAQAALSAGNAARALQQLDRHAKGFPGSMLAEERDVARIEALCQLGRTTKVRAAKRRFARSFPGSPLSGRAKSACPEASP